MTLSFKEHDGEYCVHIILVHFTSSAVDLIQKRVSHSSMSRLERGR